MEKRASNKTNRRKFRQCVKNVITYSIIKGEEDVDEEIEKNGFPSRGG